MQYLQCIEHLKLIGENNFKGVSALNNRDKFLIGIIVFCIISIMPTNIFCDDGILRIAGDNNYPPYEYVDENGVFKGFNVDIMRAIAIELELDIEIIPMTWDEAQRALEKGEVDAIQGMTKTRIRDEIFDFTEELVINSQALFVKKDTSFIQDMKDLSGLKVAFQKGDVTNEVMKTVASIIPVEKENQTIALDALLNGEVDAFVGNRLTGLYYLQKIKRMNEVKIIGEPMYVTQYCSATKNNNAEILNVLNEGISIIKKNGTYDKIYKKWFGQSFTDTGERWRKLLYVSVIVLCMAFCTIIVIIYWNKSLKSEVASQTRQLVKSQVKLDQSNRLRGKIIESIVSGIVAFDNTSKVIQSNSFAKEIFEQEIINGMRWDELSISEMIDADILERVLKGDAWRADLRWTMKDDDVRFVNCSLIPIKGPDIIEGVILLLYDYTKEKRLNEIVQHDDKMQALGKLSAGIAHEIRNPLTSIKAFIDMIPAKLDNENFRAQLLKIIPQEINRLNNLVSILLDYSRPKVSNPQQISLDGVLSDILVLFSSHTIKKNIQVINRPNNLLFWADMSQIKQVLINIILNSIDAIDKEGEIFIEGSLENKKAVIRILDNGCGIPKEKVFKVFEPFYTSKRQGYGIGLAITHQLISENKGEIFIESEAGKGTTVIIHLPVTAEDVV